MSAAAPTFSAYSLSHWFVLGLTLIITLSLIAAARKNHKNNLPQKLGYTLAALLFGNMVAMLIHGIFVEPQKWVDLLPMHLCDWLGFIAPAALIWRKQLLYEITYFLGLAGTLQGVLTPDLAYGFPHFYFFTFFIAHCGIITAVCYLTFGLKMRPQPSSLLRVFIFIQFYLLCAYVVNLLLDTNFGYLRFKPENPSLIDYLGPWPWYLLSMELLALLFFFLYYAPWWWADRFKKSVKPGE
jgi:hypothetical integral membrane protein (TIGR02206 family)